MNIQLKSEKSGINQSPIRLRLLEKLGVLASWQNAEMVKLCRNYMKVLLKSWRNSGEK
uniref:Uncharacterized protein n=1 Tax=Rhizophagus irregularis (strain DAOM 181602 / DAOM 197198 / MUCL 43194) TaxID=747089 RepID=U9TGF4_RHIID